MVEVVADNKNRTAARLKRLNGAGDIWANQLGQSPFP
jgi:transcriptional/translational regulatory protein YebC/TACO1